MKKTNFTETKRFKHKSYYSYYNPDSLKTILFTEYRFKGISFKVKKLSKNQKRKAKRYNKKFKPTICLNKDTGSFNKKQFYSKQQEHFKIILFDTPFKFNNGYLKTLNLSSNGIDKISLLIENIISQ